MTRHAELDEVVPGIAVGRYGRDGTRRRASSLPLPPPKLWRELNGLGTQHSAKPGQWRRTTLQQAPGPLPTRLLSSHQPARGLGSPQRPKGADRRRNQGLSRATLSGVPLHRGGAVLPSGSGQSSSGHHKSRCPPRTSSVRGGANVRRRASWQTRQRLAFPRDLLRFCGQALLLLLPFSHNRTHVQRRNKNLAEPAMRCHEGYLLAKERHQYGRRLSL